MFHLARLAASAHFAVENRNDVICVSVCVHNSNKKKSASFIVYGHTRMYACLCLMCACVCKPVLFCVSLEWLVHLSPIEFEYACEKPKTESTLASHKTFEISHPNMKYFYLSKVFINIFYHAEFEVSLNWFSMSSIFCLLAAVCERFFCSSESVFTTKQTDIDTWYGLFVWCDVFSCAIRLTCAHDGLFTELFQFLLSHKCVFSFVVVHWTTYRAQWHRPMFLFMFWYTMLFSINLNVAIKIWIWIELYLFLNALMRWTKCVSPTLNQFQKIITDLNCLVPK